MSRIVPPLPPELRALLDQEREPPAQPAAVRQRALARARAALTAHPNPNQSMPALARPHGKRWFLATTLTCAVAAAAGATAYELRARFAPQAPPATRAPQALSTPPAAPVAETTQPRLSRRRSSRARLGRRVRARRRQTLSRAEAAALELRILRPARVAVAREDFADALAPIAEHARRFQDGRLAEEREALRVKALAGLGRLNDARRAAAAFKVRFPRSVLLPAVSRLAETGQ